MSVLLVTADSDDDVQLSDYEHRYHQIKEFEYNCSSNDSPVSSIVHPKSAQHHHYRRRRSRPQPCLAKHLFTYMLTLLFLTNHLHWSIILFSFSSIKVMSTYASPILLEEDEQQCSPINASYVERICSKSCRAQRTPLDNVHSINQFLLDSHYFPFCSNYILNHSINHTVVLNEMTEKECQATFNQLMKFDQEAQNASELFAKYMQAIDSASKENRYSIINSNCQQAYETWACAVKIPYFHRNQLVPPCQTICDEVERGCPTFRPSDREPLFAGQPLFFCNGGIVKNSDYGRRPHCFDTCHLADDSSQRHSVLSSSSPSSWTKLVKDHVTTPLCFEIEPIPLPSSSEFLPRNDSLPNQTSNASISASAISIISSAWSSIIVIILILLLKILQE